ncbi:PREDICTED: fibrocystin-like [Tinamus guttatus]|uniref:fibrocystin-like n=1 Tax=Tinamus guttatus TaxID=94827 RepID=UPI00052E7E2C|nr:PREDICTED: fibrocystin-like [Tinamus guttatus]
MNLLRSFLSAELILFAVTATGLHIKPREGSVAGGTWITITLPGSTSHQHFVASGSHLEVFLVNPGLPRLPCDVSPVYFNLSTIRCRTRSSSWEALYHVELLSEGRVINNLTGVEKDSYTFKFSAVQTPVVYQISPPSGVPGNLIELYGKTITGRYETLDFNVDYIDGPALLVAEGDGWTSLCSFADKQAGHIYPIQVEDGLGTLQCRVEGSHIGSHNVSFSVFNKGRSAVHKDAWLISAKQDLFLYQTHSEVASVFPASGSLGGGTELTIIGDFFEEPVQVTVAGVRCKVQHLSPQKISCTTEPASKGRRLAAPQPGNRGLLFEVWDDASDLTEAGPGYRWQFVPNASSPVRFLSGAKQSFSSRLRGFFVAPETNNYTFWIQADGQASLYLSLSQDPERKAKIASLPAGNSVWLEHWEKSWNESWQPKSPKFELTAGSRYYLEAWHHGKAPSSGMRVGVQIHNTWLNPHVVNTYYRERHEIRACALQLPEVQMLTVSGAGWFSISWNNIFSNMIPTNATAEQVQIAIEGLLSVQCETEPSSAKILFQNGFEKGTKDSVTTGRTVSGTEPFCGRFSVHRPEQLVKTSPSTLPRYDLTEYTHVCFAHKGYMSKILHISVSYTNATLHSVKRNLTCQWDFNDSNLGSWTFTCTNLWKGCVNRSMLFQDLPANSPVYVRQIDLPIPEMQKETSESFYLDELIITDSNVTVSQRSPKPPWPDGRIIEAVTVVGSSPTYNVSLLVAGCGANLPLLSLRGALLLDGSEEDGHLSVSTEDARINLTVRRLQKSSPPIGGTFRIYLANTVISDIPVHISSNHLHRLLQDNTDNSTAPYFNISDFTVMKDSKSCYENIWTLTWKTKTGDLPNVINVRHLAVSLLSDDGSQATIVIRGTGFTGEKPALQVEVNSSACHVITLNETKLVCQMERLPVGVYQVTLLVRPYGFALNTSTGEGIFLRVEPKLVAIEPPTASEIGGLRVALRGTGLEGVNLVLFGSQPCPISANARNATRIECQVPSRGIEDAVVPVTLVSGHLSTTFTNLFQYDPSLNPVVVSLSRNRSGITGGQELQIGISSFALYQGLDIKVQVGHLWGQIQAQTDRGVNVTLPALAPGWYNISVIINSVVVATSNRTEPLIQYASEIFSIEPCCGSLLGGTLLTISGVGFSQNPALVSVSLNEQTCRITHLSEETIWCLTPPAANLSNDDSQDISASVNVLLRSRLLLHTSFEKNTTVFNYQRISTPLITTFGMEVTGSSLFLSIQGINITESVAKLGDSECALESQHGNNSAILSQCSLPLTNLEPGTYPIRVIQRQLGYAHVAGRLQSVTITPQITSIFPKQGSICGGMVLVISGTALKSRRNLVQVSLGGNYSCEIQNSGDNVIRCFLLPGAHPLPYERLTEASRALNVTVTVNGIGSVCLGDCTLHLHEQRTPLIDLVTWENSGAFTYLMIKGQQLAWQSDSPVVHVNNQVVCKVTFWNETNIKCQMDCIAPGKYNISVSNGRSGQACFRRAAEDFTVMPQVHQFYPENFSTNGGGLLTLAGSAMKGRTTSVLVDHHPCLILSVNCTAIQCIVPPGNGTSALRLKVDDINTYLGRITYSEEFTPAFLSLMPVGLLLMMTVSRVIGTDGIHVFVGGFACSGVTITQSTLQCSAPPLPAGKYHVLGLDVLRGWASSNLTFTSQLSVTSVHHNWGGLNGEAVHLRGMGFSPGHTLVTICGTPCEILGNMTTTALSCLAPRLNASLAILCGLKHSAVDCQEAGATFIKCDVQVTVASYHQKQSTFYLYMCDHHGAQGHRGNVNVSRWQFAGLFVSPKVERDEVLIYNSSCNITMETEAEMECEGANQPITAKITEIWKNWGQNTQV